MIKMSTNRYAISSARSGAVLRTDREPHLEKLLQPVVRTTVAWTHRPDTLGVANILWTLRHRDQQRHREDLEELPD